MDRNIRVAVYIAVGLMAWFASGWWQPPQPETATEQVAASAKTVEVREFSPQSYRPRMTLRAVTEPRRAVELRAEVGGVLLDRPQPQGGEVAAGEVICKLDPRARAESLAEAEAALQVAELDYQGAQRLQQAGIQSQLAIATARAKLQSARAAQRRAEIDLLNSEVVAPFAGVVERIMVERGDLLQPGQSCAQLLQLDPIKVVAYVTEQEIAQISSGDAVSVQLVTGQQLSGTINYVARSDEGITHSYRIEALAANDSGVAAGVSAELQLQLPELMAVKIPAHLIVLDRRGELIVRAVDSAERVVEIPVQQIDEQLDGVWVTGLVEPQRLITVGQNYVSAGDTVVATAASAQP